MASVHSHTRVAMAVHPARPTWGIWVFWFLEPIIGRLFLGFSPGSSRVILCLLYPLLSYYYIVDQRRVKGVMSVSMFCSLFLLDLLCCSDRSLYLLSYNESTLLMAPAAFPIWVFHVKCGLLLILSYFVILELPFVQSCIGLGSSKIISNQTFFDFGMCKLFV